MRLATCLILIASTLLASESFAQIHSTNEGGLWSDGATWEGGVVPGPEDDVVLVGGATVTLTYAAAEPDASRNLTIEEGALLTRSVAVEQLVVHGDLTNEGAIVDVYEVFVLGSVINDGEIDVLSFYTYGSVENRGTWSQGAGTNRLLFAGDGERNIQAQGVEARITIGRSIDYSDPIEPRPALVGDNHVPTFIQPARGGDALAVMPGATFEIAVLGQEVDVVYESEFWLYNHGAVVTHYPHDSWLEPDAVLAHGALFQLGAAAQVAPLRLTAWGDQAPSGLSNAVQQWWQIESTNDESSASFESVLLHFSAIELGELESDDLVLYHSADGGGNWEVLQVASLEVRDFPNGRGETFYDVNASGTFPVTGAYAIALGSASVSADPSDLAYGFGLYSAYPNPFNPSTTIRFELARQGEVELSAYNVLGQQVLRRALGRLPAGVHQEELNLDWSPSGVYFYELRVMGEHGPLFRSVDSAVLLK